MNISEQELHALRMVVFQLQANLTVLAADLHLIKIHLDEGKYDELSKEFLTLLTDSHTLSSNIEQVTSKSSVASYGRGLKR